MWQTCQATDQLPNHVSVWPTTLSKKDFEKNNHFFCQILWKLQFYILLLRTSNKKNYIFHILAEVFWSIYCCLGGCNSHLELQISTYKRHNSCSGTQNQKVENYLESVKSALQFPYKKSTSKNPTTTPLSNKIHLNAVR